MAGLTGVFREGTLQYFFRPALFWQEIQPGQVCDGGLEFNMGLGLGEEGVNKARLPVGDFDMVCLFFSLSLQTAKHVSMLLLFCPFLRRTF